jgi:predicted O-methyltransferase YrrM
MKETDAIDEYILQHIDEESDYLKALYRDTHVKLLRPRMASGHLQGRMLKMFVQMIRPRQVLEIGTYSGYSALCLAEGDALKLLPGMNITFDLAFVDGDKRKYIEYYEMVLEKLSPGGYIIADNTLWDGHVLEEPHHTDLQTIGIKKFNDLVAADKRVEKVILPLRDGLTIIRKC